MKYRPVILGLVMLVVGHTVMGQQDETRLDVAQAKITTVSAMRVRKAPQITAEEIRRLKLGTVVNPVARSTNQDTIAGKTDYWYRVTLPNGETGWLFGGLLLDYNAHQRNELLRQILEARLRAEIKDFADLQEIYDLAASSAKEAKDLNTRAEFEAMKLVALSGMAMIFPPDAQRNKSPYREWLKAHAAEVIPNEFSGGYNLRSELLWNLETKYHSLPIAEQIAWEAATNEQPSDCEGDEICHFFLYEGEIRYLNLHPNGAHAPEALGDFNAALTEGVIKAANDKGGDIYAVQQRKDLRKLLASLRTAVAKTSAPGKTELLKKLERVSTR